MVDRNLIREFQVEDLELEQLMSAVLTQPEDGSAPSEDELYQHQSVGLDPNEIITGTIIRVDSEEVLVDIGYKAEGVVQREEWEDTNEVPVVGETVSVLLEEIEDGFGFILLSKRKADRQRLWDQVIKEHDEDDVVTGAVVRKIKGGLLVDIGVHVFLPASQVDIRRPPDIADFIGQDIECVILKIDEARRNIVVSRRKLIEDRRETAKKDLLGRITEGDVVTGVVKNIADFGAFVDLGGIDGLLHITDMTWRRINHPTESVKIDDEIQVKILNIDRDREKIALGMKQLTPSPWESAAEKYPVGSRVQGEVVNVMSYGAFVKLEDGIEGLVHISEMSWVKRINHPTELVQVGDEVDVVVLGVNLDKQEISLGMKQTQPNPWDKVAEKYPPGQTVAGTVRNLTNYGAFIELEEGVDGLLHVSDMSWTRKISHANEMLKKGDAIECQVLSVDQERKRIALGLKQLGGDPWEDRIPTEFAPGSVVTGKVTKITNFGVFVQLEEELEGLLHISELADHKVENPEEIVNVGEDIEVRILRVDTSDRKIGLSRKLEGEVEEEVAAVAGATPSTGTVAPKAPEELRGGMGGAAGPLFQMPIATPEEDAAEKAAAEATAAADGEGADDEAADGEVVAEETAAGEDGDNAVAPEVDEVAPAE